KGAVTKHINRILEGLLDKKANLSEEDAEVVANVDQKQLEKARDLGKGLLRDALEQAEPNASAEDLRELTNDLCLRTDGKIAKEDLDAIVQWLVKVREAYQDIESRKEDAKEAAVDSVRRLEETWQLFKELEPKLIVNDEQIFRELKDRFGSPYGFGVYFQGGMGAESIRELLKDLDLKGEAKSLRETIKSSKGQKQQRAIKRLKVVNAFITSENRPEWMVLEAIPVIPPELRPMVQLDGGRFATSDLNDLYRRVINRNNRLKRLLDLGAPEIIVNNEKRMLQEAVDALFDNGRRGRAVTGPGNRALKSLSDMLKGKQGRFRQNLLGKRVDYSGRSVIVAGPNLKLHQCGIPKLMALELFKPFIMSRLVERKSVQNIKAAKKHVDSMVPEVWDVLEEVIAEHPVLLNRAPTLHRLGIQAFEPVLVEGKAIQVHPLVCHAFNADFDGDQMAVHLPLSAEAQAEARILMLSSNNILSPANGRPLATPTQDMVLGGYYLTYSDRDLPAMSSEDLDPRPKRFAAEEDVEMAVEDGQVGIQQPIEYRYHGELVLTTPGRVILNAEVERSLREGTDGDLSDLPFMNRTLSKKEMDTFISELADRYGAHVIAGVLDTIKSLGFHYATKAGITISKNDIIIPQEKEELLAGYEEKVSNVEGLYERGLITEEERHEQIVNLWTEATEDVAQAMEKTLFELNPIFMMANSGARGSFKQIRQLAGMRGLMANPKGEIIERPIKANFMEGLSVLEYFISTHGARKGGADTALRTADSGYLTRRLVDVSQDVIIREEDCKTKDFIELPLHIPEGVNKSILGRVLGEEIHKPLASGKPGKTVVAEKGAVVTNQLLVDIEEAFSEHELE
ncbi:MAG: DNA-directed RNA polymerase subunit beta', partial [Actinobacteria bacterium]